MKSLLFKESKQLLLAITFFYFFLTLHLNNKKYIKYLILTIILLYWFYRSPERFSIFSNKNFIYSACDGKIIKIEENKKHYRICTFLSPFDVHVQYYPCNGKIVDRKYKPGKFTPAFLKKSKHNERMETTIKTDIGNIKVIQIAGVFVKRITAFHKVGTWVQRGKHLGLIKFGSRVDIILPKDKVKLLVREGDRIKAAITKIATIVSKK